MSNDELRAVWQAAGEDAYGSIIKLLALTAQRRDEVGAMTWGELDFESATWVIPAKSHEEPSCSRSALVGTSARDPEKGTRKSEH